MHNVYFYIQNLYNMYKFSIWLVLILIQTVFISLSAQSYAKIDPSLLSVFQSKKEAEYIILMKDRKVFQGPLPFKSKNEKTNFVYFSYGFYRIIFL